MYPCHYQSTIDNLLSSVCVSSVDLVDWLAPGRRAVRTCQDTSYQVRTESRLPPRNLSYCFVLFHCRLVPLRMNSTLTKAQCAINSHLVGLKLPETYVRYRDEVKGALSVPSDAPVVPGHIVHRLLVP